MRKKLFIEMLFYFFLVIISISMLIWGKPPKPAPVKIPQMDNISQQKMPTELSQIELLVF